MVHSEFAWDRLNKAFVSNWDDLEATAKDVELLDGSGNVIPLQMTILFTHR